MIYIIIPVFNRINFTAACLESLAFQTYKDYEAVVVDHGSSDGTSAHIADKFPEVKVLKGDESMWWAAATNLGVRYALDHNADYILTLNNDLVVDTFYLSNLIKAAEKQPGSIIGSVSVDINNREKLAYAGTKWSQLTAKYSSPVPIKLPYSQFKSRYDLIKTDLLPGRGTLIPGSVFREIGLFDDINFPQYMADEEFSLRARKAGHNLFICASAVVNSHVAATGVNSGGSKKKRGYSYLKDTFTSIRSPNKFSVRWNWAKKSKVPFLYFLVDFGRVFVSQLLKSIKS